jgi:VWFA-related protein
MAAIAIVVPSDVYLRNPANAEALLAARLWEGVSLWKLVPGGGLPISLADLHVQSASPKELVNQFLKREKWPAEVPPVSAAWAITQPPASDAISVKPGRKTGDAGQPVMPEKTRIVPSGDQVIRVSTTLVTVPVIATDLEGKCVSDLTLTDFHLYENGVEQKIDPLISESAPFQTALMMDISPSTGLVRSDIEAAALSFAKGLRADDQLMVLSFTNRIYVESELTRDQNQLRHAITQSRARAGTPYFGADPVRRQEDRTRSMGTRLYDAVELAVTERFDRFSGRKAILLFTDGVDTGSRLANSQSTIARIEESDVLVYVVRYDTPVSKIDVINRKRDRDSIAGAVAAYEQGADYLQQLAIRSGGCLFNASTDAGFREALSYIAEEMGHQYALCYYPTAPLNDSSFRRIQVTVEKPGIKIRARTGYRPVSKLAAAKR